MIELKRYNRLQKNILGCSLKYACSFCGLVMVSIPRARKNCTKNILMGEAIKEMIKYFFKETFVRPNPKSKKRIGIIGKNLKKKILKKLLVAKVSSKRFKPPCNFVSTNSLPNFRLIENKRMTLIISAAKTNRVLKFAP